MTTPVLCLASASPRRRELLAQIGVEHIVCPAHIDESLRSGEPPDVYVTRMAAEKAAAVAARPTESRGLPVLAADTSVVIGTRILGKPTSREDGIGMLLSLAGHTHEVLTAVCLMRDGFTFERLSTSEVRFRSIDRREAERYWDTGEPADKAGGYAVQGFGAVFVESLRGSYSGVMGLPLFETAALLGEAGLPAWGPSAT